MADTPLPLELLRVLKPQLSDMLRTLRRFVTLESPSLEKEAADLCCTVVAKEWRKSGARVERIPQKHCGDHLRVTFVTDQSRPAGRLFVLGHYDTVYSTGTLREMPFGISGGK